MSLRIYVSSTFEDLVQQRERVAGALRSLRHDVLAMEDYVAADKRPLQQCLEDVASSDVYVGILAWRYGYVPTADNPKQLSITEMELREAERLGKPRLIFILKETAPWPRHMDDQATGDNDRGARILALRNELQSDRLAGMFETADELALKVVSALYRWQIESSGAPQEPEPETVQPGELARPREGYDKLWAPGSTLRVRFLEGPELLHRRVLRIAHIWSAYANISFEPSDDEDAEVRVAFDKTSGSWSYEGPSALFVGPKQQTVNFGWISPASPIDELEAVVLHEFGHVLGLAHEHNNPNAGIPWDAGAIYESMGGPPNNWDRQQVDNLFFNTWSPDRFPFAKPFDPLSISAFPIPPEFTKDGSSIGRNVSISPGDREFISRLYPYSDAPTPPPPPARERSKSTATTPKPSRRRSKQD